MQSLDWTGLEYWIRSKIENSSLYQHFGVAIAIDILHSDSSLIYNSRSMLSTSVSSLYSTSHNCTSSIVKRLQFETNIATLC